MKAKPKIDQTDVKILKALLKDTRTEFADIAKECNLSITAITQRYRKLKQNGIITGTTIILNPPKYRNQNFTSIDIKAESDYENSIIEDIKKIPGIRVCFKTIGKYNIHASIIAESLKQLDKIKNEIKKQKGVIEIEITLGLDRLCVYPENLILLQK